MRNKKDEYGNWVSVPFYKVDDKLHYGHGEGSVVFIEKFMKLTDEERYSIRWHSGGFDKTVAGGDFNSIRHTYDKYPLAVALHLADMMATHLCDKSGG